MRWIGVLVLCAACSSPGRNAAVQALDATDVAMAQAALLASNADSLGNISISTGDEAAQAAALAWPGQWEPAGCLVVATTPATVTAVFSDCNGPYGLQHVSGTVVILFTSVTKSATGAKTIAAVAEGVGFGANAAVFDVQAAATWRIDGANRELTVAAQGAAVEATGAHGTAVTQQAGYTADWDDQGCVTLTGAWQSVVDAKISQLSVTRYKTCAGMCPVSGSIVATSVGGLLSTNVVTLDFDGTAAVTYTGLGHGTISLVCR